MLILALMNVIIAIVFLMCYVFQLVYLVVPYVKKAPEHKPEKIHNFAVLICARNEESVICDLIESIKNQDYPSEHVKIFVVADNCNDRTAEVAKGKTAIVYERFDNKNIGKGFALDFGLSKISEDFGENTFDAFIVFDADNILEKNFITEINKTFSDGYEVITTYRNAKNYSDNWLSAGAGIWFLRESKYLNFSRMLVGASAQVSGTGFLFSNDVRKEYGGWPFHTLTEDYEFTCHSVVNGRKFGYCNDARFYDGQTVKFKDSWNQRLRWVKGGLQSFSKFGKQMLKGVFSKNFISCYDMVMSFAPAYAISILACLINVVGVSVLVNKGYSLLQTLLPAICLVIAAYLIVVLQSIVVTISEWKYIKATKIKKILYIFTFPVYMLTFIPIAFVALLKKNVAWKSGSLANNKNKQ